MFTTRRGGQHRHLLFFVDDHELSPALQVVMIKQELQEAIERGAKGGEIRRIKRALRDAEEDLTGAMGNADAQERSRKRRLFASSVCYVEPCSAHSSSRRVSHTHTHTHASTHVFPIARSSRDETSQGQQRRRSRDEGTKPVAARDEGIRERRKES